MGAARFARWAAALALGLAAGCSGSVPGAPDTGSAPPQGQAAAGASLLGQIANAPGSVVHGGTRRFEAHWIDGGQPQVLEYVESVLTDGLGNVLVDALQVVHPPLGGADFDLFGMLHQLRQRTMYFARDFGVRDVGQFTANYVLVDTGQSVVVAGVTCERLSITRRVSPDRRYVVDVDLNTGLVLASREELLDGTLVSRVTYETLTYAPDLSSVTFSAPINGEEALDPGSSEASAKLGFDPRLPKVLPTGWELTRLSKIVDPLSGQVWAKVVYSDGVEQIFYMVAKAQGPKHQLKNPPAGSPPGQPDRVRKMAVGAWTLLDAELAHGRALLLGRTADGVLEGLVQSAFF